MKRQLTRLLTALLAVILLLPVTAQAAPAWDGWTAELEAAYQTVSRLVADSVSESRDYLSAARQETNAKAVYALWASGADVPEGFYNEYLQALADWLALAEQRGRYAYIPGALRTVAAMGLDVTDLAGHDLLEPLRRPEMVEADEDRLDMLLDLDAAGDAGKTDEFDALREALIAEALARQQDSGQVCYNRVPYGLSDRYKIVENPSILPSCKLTAKTVAALAPYMERTEVAASIEAALTYLSEQQLAGGGFAKYAEENVEEDAAVLEMMYALRLSPKDAAFTKSGNTVLDGMMGYYQDFYYEKASSEPKQGFYVRYTAWAYQEQAESWFGGTRIQQNSNDASKIDDFTSTRIFKNEVAYIGLAIWRNMAVGKENSTLTYQNTIVEKNANKENPDYKAIKKEMSETVENQLLSDEYYSDGKIISEDSISRYASQILALQSTIDSFSKTELGKLQENMNTLVAANTEYYLGQKSKSYSAGAVRAMLSIGLDPSDVNGMDYLAPLTTGYELDRYDRTDALKDFDAVNPTVWRARGIDVDVVVKKYAAAILASQMPNGKFNYNYEGAVKTGDVGWIESVCSNETVAFTAECVDALATHTDKAYIASAVEKALSYLSSIQLADGTFPGENGTPNGKATLSVIDLMNTLGIPLDDPRFVKNGNTVADGLKTFYVSDIGFVNNPEAQMSLEDFSANIRGEILPTTQTLSALTYLQAAEDGTFGPDGKGSSVFEVVGAALTETPLGAILLAVIVVAILAFAMVRRYRRIKREQ